MFTRIFKYLRVHLCNELRRENYVSKRRGLSAVWLMEQNAQPSRMSSSLNSRDDRRVSCPNEIIQRTTQCSSVRSFRFGQDLTGVISWNSASRLFIRKWSRRLLKAARKQEIIVLTSNYRSFVSEMETTGIGRREGNDGGLTYQNDDVDINGTDGSTCQTTS
jgi:hypothetical protein